MIGSVTRDLRAPYTAAESFLYDTVVAPAATALHAGFIAENLHRVPEGGGLLEVGCGGGQLLAALARARPDLALTGLDLSPEQVRRARQRTRAFADRVECVEGSALDLPFDGDRFDAVVSVASIKHWPDPRRGLGECLRVLRPGGLLYVVEADRGCRPDDVRAFVRATRLPRALRPVGDWLFRLHVAGGSFDLDDARDLLAGRELAEAAVERVPGQPIWALQARKPPAASAPARERSAPKKASTKRRKAGRAG